MSRIMRLVGNIVLCMLALLVDRVTKQLAMAEALPHIPLPFVTCSVTMNRGISWGWFHSAGTAQFMVITLLIASIIIFMAAQVYQRWKKNEYIWLYSLVLGAAVSNMIDRILYGGVIDFIELACYGWSWPVFNVADILIVVGLSGIVIRELRQ